MVMGLSVLLWALWEEARPPLLYESGLWSIVFPVGMYGVASHELGAVLHVRWMTGLGTDVVWAGAILCCWSSPR